jgi:osmoprotectant transport system permease protein
MAFLLEVLGWLTDPASWVGPGGILERTWEHVWYAALAALGSIVIALPIGLYVGHTGRGGQLAINLANFGRAIPAFGILTIAFTVLGFGYPVAWIALVALGLVPIVTNTFVGIQSVDRDVREAAEGMGLTGWQVLTRVEVPVALPLIMAGIRTSTVQIVATVSLAAVVSLGGLGRFIVDGLSRQRYEEVVGGALLIAALAMLTEGVLGALQRALTPRGLRADRRHEIASRTAPVTVGGAAPT